MAIYKPSELFNFLNSLGISPRKSLSQNFLIDGNILRKIIATANVQQGDCVIEVGPGPGSLTESLLNAGAKVLAVEKDPILAKALDRLQTEDEALRIFCDDILKFPLTSHLPPDGRSKLIANLPYNITTPILAYLVPMHQWISKIVVMVQEEVARRFTAEPGNSDYSSFTVFLNYYCRPRYGFKVSRNCFYPVPNVDSAVVILDLRPPPQLSDRQLFFELTRTAFEHRRKMLRSSLRSLYAPETVMAGLSAIGKSVEARPEQLSLDDFIGLFEWLNASAKEIDKHKN